MVDPDLQIRGGPGHPDPEIREGRGGGGGVVSKIFSALRPSVWSKNKREGIYIYIYIIHSSSETAAAEAEGYMFLAALI